MILGYRKDDFIKYKIKIPVSISLPLKTSNILITGKSGSGKSLSALWYIWQMLSKNESICYIADYKGGIEYEFLEGSSSYASGEKAIEMIEFFYDLFTYVRNKRIRLCHHYTLCIEEWLGLLLYVENKNKKRKAELMAKVGELLSVARGLNLGIMLCIQRADSSNFSAGAREQFQCVLSFGRCSSEQFKMLGFSGELESNPTQNFKSGQALSLVDGQDGVQEIIVPLVKNPEILCQQIRCRLDKQSDIASLVRALAEGSSAEL